MRRICVYCGSSPGKRPAFALAATSLADVLVRHDLELVYGGADLGLMGVLANAVLNRGGKVHGVIPQLLMDKEIAHEGLTELHVVASMHARKTMMAALSDGFIALPGGFGTLEEIVEVVTWRPAAFSRQALRTAEHRRLFRPAPRVLRPRAPGGFPAAGKPRHDPRRQRSRRVGAAVRALLGSARRKMACLAETQLELPLDRGTQVLSMQRVADAEAAAA